MIQKLNILVEKLFAKYFVIHWIISAPGIILWLFQINLLAVTFTIAIPSMILLSLGLLAFWYKQFWKS